jgi:hypothetical protein
MDLYAENRYREALEIWEKILTIDPDHAKAVRYINKTREELSRLESMTGR